MTPEEIALKLLELVIRTLGTDRTKAIIESEYSAVDAAADIKEAEKFPNASTRVE